MRKLLMIAAVALLPVAAQAQFSLGLRLGFAPAMGDLAKTADGAESLALNDLVKSQIPLQLDAMYKVTPDVAVGGYFSYGFGQLNSDVSDQCDAAGSDCSASSWRLRVQGTYTFNKVSPAFFPWLGAGIGYESLTVKESQGGLSVSTDFTGFEFLNLQAGGDYKVNEQFSVGPYVQFSLGQYSSAEGEDIPETSMHQWLNFGVRGKFDL
jgi:outer membrane protein W